MYYTTMCATAVVLFAMMIGVIKTDNSVSDPIPSGCEATPLDLSTTIVDPKSTGFDKIDDFNMSAKMFRAQTLGIADNALKLTVTMCQVNDPEIGEYTHRECFTGLDLQRTDDCAGAVRREGKGVVLERIASTLVDGTATLALGENLVSQSAQVSKTTMDEVKGNPVKLRNARGAVGSMDETVVEVKKSMEALRAAMKYAEGSKAALEKWDLQ
jgi:hypothetical protein